MLIKRMLTRREVLTRYLKGMKRSRERFILMSVIGNLSKKIRREVNNKLQPVTSN